jgi:hypothetical protein
MVYRLGDIRSPFVCEQSDKQHEGCNNNGGSLVLEYVGSFRSRGPAGCTVPYLGTPPGSLHFRLQPWIDEFVKTGLDSQFLRLYKSS